MRRLSRPTDAIALAVLAVTAGVLSCTRRPPAADPAYLKEIEAWRADRLARLTSDTGWLTLVGLHWLQPGASRFGAAADNEIVLAGEGVPAHAGELEVGPDGQVLLRPAAVAAVTIAGEPAGERRLRSDRDGRADVLEVGRLRLHLIDRSGSLALRVRDPGSPRRTGFTGIEHFPVDPRLRVRAALERYPSPREVAIASAQGPPQTMLAPGLLRFTLRGREVSLEAWLSSPESSELFIVFADATSGHETYGAGRFIDAELSAPDAAEVWLDFNTAYNPPCAFSPYATCPLPPARNVLPVRVEAGEKATGLH